LPIFAIGGDAFVSLTRTAYRVAVLIGVTVEHRTAILFTFTIIRVANSTRGAFDTVTLKVTFVFFTKANTNVLTVRRALRLPAIVCDSLLGALIIGAKFLNAETLIIEMFSCFATGTRIFKFGSLTAGYGALTIDTGTAFGTERFAILLVGLAVAVIIQAIALLSCRRHLSRTQNFAVDTFEITFFAYALVAATGIAKP